MILNGVSGANKSWLAQGIAQQWGARCEVYDGTTLIDWEVENGTQRLTKIYNNAVEHQGNTLLVITNIQDLLKFAAPDSDDEKDLNSSMFGVFLDMIQDKRIYLIATARYTRGMTEHIRSRIGMNRIDLVLPDEATCNQLLNYYVKDIPCDKSCDRAYFNEVAKFIQKRYSIGDIEKLVDKAKKYADSEPKTASKDLLVQQSHFAKAITETLILAHIRPLKDLHLNK